MFRGEQRCQLIKLAAQEVAEAKQHLGTLRGGRGGPARQGLRGRLDSLLRLLRAGKGYARTDLTGGRVQDVTEASAGALHFLPTDIVVQ